MKKSTKTYLVTGGNGFIGRSIVNLLIQLNQNVIIFDNNFRSYNRFKNDKIIKYIKGDIRNLKSVNNAAKNVDTIIHLAYINGTKYFYTNPKLILDVAVRGILNIIDASKKNNVKELFLASSSEVYSTPKIIPTPEDIELKIEDILNPRFSYGGGKILSELIALHYSENFFKRLIIFRPHNVYGPDMGNEHVIPELVNKIKNAKKTIKIQGSGLETRSFIYIEDFQNAFKILLKKGKDKNIYNIGTNDEITIQKLLNKILKICHKKLKIVKSNKLKGSVKRRQPNIKKLKTIGFCQKFSIDDGLNDTVKWYLNK
tara:strand:+ start:5799 stop:6740 length:942 start_codon:yes stop_codon:yes gene_type:complete